MNNAKLASLNITLKDLFFKYLNVTQAFHKLNNQQQQVLALLLYYHYTFKKEVTNDKILWKLVFDYDTKLKIREDAVFGEKGLNNSTLQNILTILRKKNIIKDNKVNDVFIPELELKSKNFKIIFNFNIIDNG